MERRRKRERLPAETSRVWKIAPVFGMIYDVNAKRIRIRPADGKVCPEKGQDRQICKRKAAMNYKITGGKILKSDQDRLYIKEETLYVTDGRVYEALPEEKRKESFETVDASDRLIMPGLINLHTHAYMTLMRSYADDVPFDEWLFQRIMPVEDRLPQEAGYWGSMLAAMEMIRTGTTTFMDMHMFRGQSARAAEETGLRAYIGRGLVGEDLYGDGLSRFEDVLKEQEAYESDRVRFVLAPHAIYSASPRLYAQAAEEAEKRGMLKTTHLSESDNEVMNCLKQYGKTPVEVICETGFLDEKTSLAHCVKMRGMDLAILAGAGSSIVTNPASNAKLGNGLAPLKRFTESGVNVCLGTDGTASNNTLNLFREMGLMGLLHKAAEEDPSLAPAEDVVRMVTTGPARALGLENELGVIRDGAMADLVFIDLTEPSLFPGNNIISSLCYCANGSEVCSVMADGKFLYRDHVYTTIDTERVRHEVDRLVKEYL